MEQPVADTKKATVAYVPFASFCTALDYLKTHGRRRKSDGPGCSSSGFCLADHALQVSRLRDVQQDRMVHRRPAFLQNADLAPGVSGGRS